MCGGAFSQEVLLAALETIFPGRGHALVSSHPSLAGAGGGGGAGAAGGGGGYGAAAAAAAAALGVPPQHMHRMLAAMGGEEGGEYDEGEEEGEREWGAPPRQGAASALAQRNAQLQAALAAALPRLYRSTTGSCRLELEVALHQALTGQTQPLQLQPEHVRTLADSLYRTFAASREGERGGGGGGGAAGGVGGGGGGGAPRGLAVEEAAAAAVAALSQPQPLTPSDLVAELLPAIATAVHPSLLRLPADMALCVEEASKALEAAGGAKNSTACWGGTGSEFIIPIFSPTLNCSILSAAPPSHEPLLLLQWQWCH